MHIYFLDTLERIQPTYEELKRSEKERGEQRMVKRIQPTYEELKQTIPPSEGKSAVRYPAYL